MADEEVKATGAAAAIASLGNLVRGVYVGWIMRDLVTRAVPGALVLCAPIPLPKLEDAVSAWAHWASPHQLLAVCLSWFVGMSLEHVARWRGWAHVIGEPEPPKKELDYGRFVDFSHRSKFEEQLQYERFLVTTNAQANMAIALFVAVMLHVFVWLINGAPCPDYWPLGVLLAAMLVGIGVLLARNAKRVLPGSYLKAVFDARLDVPAKPTEQTQFTPVTSASKEPPAPV